jgi:hypothetical protein
LCPHTPAAQKSPVHALWSSQSIGAPRHIPFTHWSATVQLFASSQLSPSLQLDQGRQAPSIGTPAWHRPSAQTSSAVHALPSSHGATLFSW